MKKFLAASVLAGTMLFGGMSIAGAQTTSTAPAAATRAAKDKPANGGFSAHSPAIAKALGLSVADLDTAMKSGKTIAALATEKGVDVQKIIANYVLEEQAEHPTMSAADVLARVTNRVNNVNSGRGGHGPRTPKTVTTTAA